MYSQQQEQQKIAFPKNQVRLRRCTSAHGTLYSHTMQHRHFSAVQDALAKLGAAVRQILTSTLLLSPPSLAASISAHCTFRACTNPHAACLGNCAMFFLACTNPYAASSAQSNSMLAQSPLPVLLFRHLCPWCLPAAPPRSTGPAVPTSALVPTTWNAPYFQYHAKWRTGSAAQGHHTWSVAKAGL